MKHQRCLRHQPIRSGKARQSVEKAMSRQLIYTTSGKTPDKMQQIPLQKKDSPGMVKPKMRGTGFYTVPHNPRLSLDCLFRTKDQTTYRTHGHLNWAAPPGRSVRV